MSHAVVVREHGEDGGFLFGAGVDQGFSAVVAGHEVDQAQSFAPQRFLVVVETFAQYLVDIVGNLCRFRATGVTIGGGGGSPPILLGGHLWLCGGEGRRVCFGGLRPAPRRRRRV